MYKTTLSIDGMMCSMCEAHICEVIRKVVPGASGVKASHGKGTAEFLSEAPVDEATLKKGIADTGYELLGLQTQPWQKKKWFWQK